MDSEDTKQQDNVTEVLSDAEKAKVVTSAYRLLADHSKKMREDLEKFNKTYEATKKRANSGIRRTNGRIV